MRLEDLVKNANVSITVKGTDLLEFAQTVASETCTRMETSIIEGKTESLLTPKETGAKLGVSLPTLWRWNNRGYLRHIEVGGERRYRLSDIMKIINPKTDSK